MWAYSRLPEKLTVRTQTDKLQYLSIWLAVDQQQIGLEVALPMVAPVPSQSVIVISFGQRFVTC